MKNFKLSIHSAVLTPRAFKFTLKGMNRKQSNKFGGINRRRTKEHENKKKICCVIAAKKSNSESHEHLLLHVYSIHIAMSRTMSRNRVILSRWICVLREKSEKHKEEETRNKQKGMKKM